MMTLEECVKEWEKTNPPDSRMQREAQSKLWLEYYDYMARPQQKEPYKAGMQEQRAVSHLLREGVLKPNHTVLDIGSGAGGYAIEFAKQCQKVTALDMSEQCLQVLRTHAKQQGLTNLKTKTGCWESYEPKEKFDITFSAMCPAICNPEELLRMESITRHTACLVAVMRGSYEKHRMAMMKQLPLKIRGGMTTEAIQYYNILYLMGRKPNVKCWSEHFTYKMSTEEVLRRYALYFRIFGVESTSEAFLQEYLAQHAQQGMLEEECQMNYALLYWEVPNQA